MNFFFQCPCCGKYSVTPDTFDAPFSPELRDKLALRLKTEPVISATAKFEPDCPKCNPNSEKGYTATLEVETVEMLGC